MGIKSPSSRTGKRLVILFLLLLPVTLFGLDMEILPDILITGRVITLKILTEIPIEDELTISELEIPDGLSLISGPIVRTYYAKVDGKNVRFHQITWALRSRESGIYYMPPIEIKYAREDISVDVPTVKVFNSDERDNNFPLMVDWDKNIKRDIYVGESLPLIVEAYNLEEINFPDRIVSNSPRSGEMVEVAGLGEINPEDVDGENLYRVPVTSWIFTTFQAGRITIPAVRVDINGLTRYTDTLELNVKPLPRVNATGGVGEFLITSELSESQVTPEDLFHFKVRISGQGNIPYIKFPEVEFAGLIVIEKNNDEWIDSGDKGFLGWREIDYTLQALESGVKDIVLSEVSWIDNNGKDIFYNGSTTHINVVSVKVIEEDILPFLSFMTTPEIISSYTLFLYENPVMWISLMISSLVLVIMHIFKSYRSSREKKALLMTLVIAPYLLMSSVFAKGFEYQGQLSLADDFISNGEYLNALNIYDDLEDNLPNNYGLFVNRSILWDKLGNVSQAVYNIRIAERISPANGKINKIKEYLSESEESIQKQAKTSNPINPDYIFILLVIFFNIMVITLIKLIMYKNISQFSLFFTTLLFTLLLTVLLIFIDTKNSVDAGIISSGGANLTKVPNDKALEWMSLEEGNCVYIKGVWEIKFLIETEYGLQGWVDKDSLLVLEER